MEFALITRKDHVSFEIEQQIRKTLNSHKGWLENKEKPSLVICIGGDGTILHGVHTYVENLDHVNFIGIHTGTLGFLTDYTKEEVPQFIEDITTKELSVISSSMLEFQVEGNSKKYYALNEIAIQNALASIDTDVYIDDEHFESCKGSGVVLSTQYGSTAMIRGLNGAVVDDGFETMQLAEIMPIFNQTNRSLRSPYLMKSDRVVRFESSSFENAILNYDHLHMKLDGVHQVTCKLSDKKVHFARYRKYSYFERLRMLY